MPLKPTHIAAWPTDPKADLARVKFRGAIADCFGRFRDVPIPPGGCAVAELRRYLGASVDGGAAWLQRSDLRIAVDLDPATDETRVMPGATLTILSPAATTGPADEAPGD